jgi:hypothetical protein
MNRAWECDLELKGENCVKSYKMLLLLFGIGVLGLALAPNAKANQWNERTVFTFTEPVEVPGMALPAGTYVFRVLGAATGHDAVQIVNEKNPKISTIVFALPDDHSAPVTKSELTFEKATAASPEALRAWLYPDDTALKFEYPGRNGEEMARANTKR